MQLRIEVDDDGAGIPAADAERIFEPFFTTKPTGTGLGLAIVRSIVDGHNGALHVTSGSSGQGARVAIVLPLRGNGSAPILDSP